MGEDLIKAVSHGNSEAVSLLLDGGADVNAIPSTGFHGTALIAAVVAGHSHIVSLLLNRGADTNTITTRGRFGTALIAAVRNGDMGNLSLLLDRGSVDVNAIATTGYYATALIAAAVVGHHGILSLLLDRGADVNAISSIGDYGTTLIAAARNGDTSNMSLLLDRGADVNAMATTGLFGTALIALADNPSRDNVPLLLGRGADVNMSATVGKYGTALIAASHKEYRGNCNVVQLLLDGGADVNALPTTGNYGSALIAAVHNPYPHNKNVSLLLDRGADVNAIATAGKYGTALIAALSSPSESDRVIDVMSLLLDRGADVNTIASNIGEDETVFIAAMRKGDTRIMSLLLDRAHRQGADVNRIAGCYGTSLGAAIALRCSSETFSFLLKEGVDINGVGSDDGSVLGKAVHEGDELLVSWLLDRGADPFHVGGKYKTDGYRYATALDAAQSLTSKAGPKLVALLSETMAERDTGPDDEAWPPFPMPYVGPCAPVQDCGGTPLTHTNCDNILNFPPQSILTAEQADIPCGALKEEVLVKILVELVGIRAQVAENLDPWIRNDVGYLVHQGYDLGLAYAAVRVGWKRFNEPEFNVAAHRHKWLKQAKKLDKVRNNILSYHKNSTVQQLIKDPYQVMPRRLWDVMSNRVVEFRMLHSEALASVSQYKDLRSAPTVPAYWAITHSWTDSMEAVTTSINQYQWHVPLPRGLSLQHDLREELIGLGTMYIWLDVLCLRQHSITSNVFQVSADILNTIRVEEWKVDVPTIGNIYRAAEGIVRYFNGLGQPFLNEGWDSPRHWLKRAWTLQEIRTEYRTINGGVPRDGSSQIIMDTTGTVAGNITTLRRAIRPVQKLAAAADSSRGCSVYELAREMSKRCATQATDQVAGLLYLLRITELPTYNADLSAEDAWIQCLNVLPFGRKIELLFDFPYTYRATSQRWIPNWSQLLEWPEYNPEHEYTPTSWPEDHRCAELMASERECLGDETSVFLSDIWGVSDVQVLPINGTYRININDRGIHFYGPYLSQRSIDVTHNEQYTIVTVEPGYSDHWVLCELIKREKLKCRLHHEKGMVQTNSSEVEVEILKKVGIVRTDSGGELWLAPARLDSVVRKINALFI